MTPARPAPLLAVAHGSRDGRSAATVRELGAAVREAAPGLDVRTAFLDLSTPSVGETLRALHDEGHDEVATVPLLLGSAYHARVDLPALLDDVVRDRPRLSVRTGPVLGVDPALERLALHRVRESGADPDDPELGIVLSAVGSSDATANAAVAGIAARWQSRLGAAAVAPAYASQPPPGAPASAARPDLRAAVAALRARGARRFALASWFLAPGLLPDRMIAGAAELVPSASVAAPLGADPAVAELVLARYTAASERLLRTA